MGHRVGPKSHRNGEDGRWRKARRLPPQIDAMLSRGRAEEDEGERASLTRSTSPGFALSSKGLAGEQQKAAAIHLAWNLLLLHGRAPRVDLGCAVRGVAVVRERRRRRAPAS